MEEWNSKNKTSFRTLIKWKKFRISMLKQANYTCQICGVKYNKKRSKLLNVHHIFEEEYDNLDPKNFVVCCNSCHLNIIERIYKKIQNNSLDQRKEKIWISFLQKMKALPERKLKQLKSKGGDSND